MILAAEESEAVERVGMYEAKQSSVVKGDLNVSDPDTDRWKHNTAGYFSPAGSSFEKECCSNFPVGPFLLGAREALILSI